MSDYGTHKWCAYDRVECTCTEETGCAIRNEMERQKMTDTAQALALANVKITDNNKHGRLELAYQMQDCIRFLVADLQEARSEMDWRKLKLQEDLDKARTDIEERDRRYERLREADNKLILEMAELRAQLDALWHDIAQYVKRDTERLAQLAQAREALNVTCLSLTHAVHVIQRCSSPEPESTYGILCEEIEKSLNVAALAQVGEKTCKE